MNNLDTTQSGTSDRGQYIITASGNKFYFQDIRPEEISIEDIAHALSQQRRFTGHLARPWTVGQHSLALAYWSEEQGHSPEVQHTFLLHDASEAYLSDISRPAKRLLPGYSALENTLHEAIAAKWDLIFPHPEVVKEADYRVTADEVLAFASNTDLKGDWGFEVEPLGYIMSVILEMVSSLSDENVKDSFIARHNLLSSQRGITIG